MVWGFFFSYPSLYHGKSSCWRSAYEERISRAGTGGRDVLDLLSLADTAGPGNIPKSLTFISWL